jgi:MFS family permease
MTIFQFIVVALCIAMNVSDGYDSASMSNAAPLIRRDWGVGPDILGVAFSAQAVGMVVGAIVLAPLSDRFGRRSVILFAMALIASVMLLSGLAGSVEMLTLLRFCTGIGLGAMIASLNIVMVEFTNGRLGNILVALLHSGFALGTTISGLVAVPLIEAFGWRGIFVSGGLVSAFLCLLALMMLPESLDFLLARQPKNALARTNALLIKMRQEPLTQMPPPREQPSKQGMRIMSVLTPTLTSPTLLLWIAAFLYYVVSYFQFQWTPAVLAEAGLPEHAALSSHAATGLGSLAGNITMGLFAAAVGSSRLTGIYLACAAISLAILGLMPAMPTTMLLVAGLCSFFIQGAFTGMMITVVRFYPPELRGAGTGYVLGIGRLGAVLGPYLGGWLMSIGWERHSFYAVFALLAFGCALAIWNVVGAARRSGAPIAAAPAQTH